MANLALFDFDNTITFNDNFTPFIYYAVAPKRLAIGKVILAPLLLAYRLGIISGSRMRSFVAMISFCGRLEAEVREFGRAYARNKLPGFIRPEAIEKIQWHKSQGDTIAVVSASLDVYLSDWCRDMGLDLICTELEVRNGVMTGRYHHGDCTGAEKAKRIRERYNLQNYAVIYAYGDSKEDDEMLAIATKKYFRWQEISSN